MASKATEDRVTNRPPDGPPPVTGAPTGGPSILREDEPQFPRTLGMIGAALVIFGGMALAFNLSGRAVRVSPGWSVFFVAAGLAGLLFHAAFDRDVQFRRMYMAFGIVTLVLGVGLSLIPYPKAMGDQFRYAVPCLCISLLFFLAFFRNETDDWIRDRATWAVGSAGLVMAVVGLLGANIRGLFLLDYGVVLAALGLIYLSAFVGLRGVSDDRAYQAALGITGLGVVVMLVVIVRTLLPGTPAGYFTSYGFLLLLVGLVYAAVGVCLFSDWSLFVLTRRELGAFFYSPMAYLCLLAFVASSWVGFMGFLEQLTDVDPNNPPTEPIVRMYFFALFQVITVTIVVPVLTMRLLSEEQRSGTMEVLLTAPVDETAIVLSKFLAALLTYLSVWVPYGLYLLAIPLNGGNPFDYRPLLSFFVALIVTGSGFVSMGLFFSSLTKNQVASGVLTFVGMLALIFLYFAAHQTRDDAWRVALTHMSYLDLWFNTLEGKLVPKFLLFYLSMTVLFLFLTHKVLESRKWR